MALWKGFSKAIRVSAGFATSLLGGRYGLRCVFRLHRPASAGWRPAGVFAASGTSPTRDLPLSGKWQSDLIQLEHRTPGVGVENAITPCRLSACSMLSSVEATLVGGLLPLFSQYRTDRG